jgi:hypothetical protein
VTFTVYSVAKADNTVATVVSGAAATAEIGNGIYFYVRTDFDLVNYWYFGVAYTATTSVDQQAIPCFPMEMPDAPLSTIDTVVDSVLADTNELQGDWVNGGRLDLLVDAILADTGELQTDWVNGGRLDLLLDAVKAVTDQFTAAQSEPTGAPAANESPLDKLAYVFAALRNKLTVTASAKTFFDDAGVSMWSKTLADDGTTYSETEGA